MKITKQVDSLYSWIDKHNKDIFAKLLELSEQQGKLTKNYKKDNWRKSIKISLEKQMLLGHLIKK